MKAPSKNEKSKWGPRNIAILYIIIGELWILFSDRLTFIRLDNPNQLLIFSTLKGTLYVLISAALLYTLIARAFKQTQTSERALTENYRELEETHTQLENTYAELETTYSELESAYDELAKADLEAEKQLVEIKMRDTYINRFYEGISGGIILQNRDGQILHANQTACRLLSTSYPELTAEKGASQIPSTAHNDGTPFSWLNLPAMLEIAINNKESAAAFERHNMLKSSAPVQLEGQSTYKADVRLLEADGSYRWFTLYTDLLPGVHDEKEYLTTFFDITDDKMRQVEDEILQEINRKILRAEPLSQILNLVCTALVEQMGYKGAIAGIKEADGSVSLPARAGSAHHLDVIVRWDNTPEGQGAMGKALRRGKTQILQMKDNPDFAPWADQMAKLNLDWVISLPLIYQNEATAVLVFYTTSDQGFTNFSISSLEHFRLKMSLALTFARNQQNLQRYQFLANQTNDAMLFTTPEGRIMEANHAAVDLYGYSREELLTLSIQNLCTPKTVPFDTTTQTILSLPRGYLFQTEHRDKDGHVIHVEVNAQSADFEGEPLILNVIRDISERMRIRAELEASEARYRGMFEQMTNGVVVFEARDSGKDFIFKDFNHRAEAIEGVNREEILGKSMLELIRQSDSPMGDGAMGFVDLYRQVWETGEPLYASSIFPISDQVISWRENHVYKLPSGEVVSIYEDITPRKIVEEALWQEKERAQVTLDSIGDGVITTDPGGIVEYMNPIAVTLTGWTPLEAIGRPLESIFPIVDELNDSPAENPIQRCLREGRAVEMADNTVLIHRTGSHIAIEDSASPIRDRQGRIMGAVLVFHDVTDKRNLLKQLTYQAQHDDLTGLPNRTLFHYYLSQTLANNPNQQHAVLFLDLDRFKIINDSLGHGQGDSLLKDVSKRLVSLLRESDAVARHGGDEFLVLLSDLKGESEAAHIAQQIIDSFKQTYLLHGQEVSVSPSIGISIYPTDGRTPENLIKQADTAMYHAKDMGRNNYQFYTQSLNASMEQRLVLENNLRKALDCQEFILHYQPIIDVQTKQPLGVEALVRWHSVQNGIVAPNVFIPIAEETGLIVPLGRWILLKACRDAALLLSRGCPIRWVAVNISVRQFREEGFADMVHSVLEESGLSPQYLHLEITESLLMDMIDQTLNTLVKLRAMGISISIDDFGTGFSSLSYLRHLPIDTLKIDQSFICSLSGHSGSKVVIGVIQLAHSLGLKVIAEGVETVEEFDFLYQHRCDQVQGYLFSRPVPLEELPLLYGTPD